MKYCVIFGTGSIAQKHALILNKMGINTIAVSRNIKKKTIFHKLILYKDFNKYSPMFWVVCFPTALHKKVCQDILKKTKENKPIYCEKPGPKLSSNKIFVLYNLRYLKILKKIKKNKNNFYHFVHKANAKLWPSKINWKKRYVFLKTLGGGCVKTNSHEIDIYFFITGRKNIYVKKKYIKDVEGKKIDSEYVAKSYSNDLLIESSIIEKYPNRYILIRNIKNNKKILNFVFYNEHLSTRSKKTIVENTYNDMWKSIIKKEKNILLPTSKQCSWINNL